MKFAVLTFAVVLADSPLGSGFAAVTSPDGEYENAVLFYTEPEEAKECLECALSHAPPADGMPPLRIGTFGLGDALALCDGFAACDSPIRSHMAAPREQFASQGVVLALRGTRGLVDATSDQLRKVLDEAGIEAGSWTFPVFIAEELCSPKLMPVFLQPQQVRLAEDRRLEADKLKCMDIRQLVAATSTPWSSVRMHGPMAGTKFANELSVPLDGIGNDSSDEEWE